MGAAGRTRACDLFDEARVVARTLDLLGLPPPNSQTPPA